MESLNEVIIQEILQIPDFTFFPPPPPLCKTVQLVFSFCA